MPDYYEALESGVTTVGPDQIAFRKGEVFYKDHPILKGRKKFLAELFKPAESLGRGDVEQTTAAPGEKRGEKHEKSEKRGEK